MALEVAILADDLTGALDAAAPFAQRGLATTIALTVDDIDAAAKGSPAVIAVSTASRALSAVKAMSLATLATSKLAALSPRIAFKKVDSRLKGNCEAETGAAMSGFGRRRGIASPAIPDLGRIVEGGAVQGFGVPAPIPVRESFGDLAGSIAVPDVATMADLDAVAAEILSDGKGLLAIGARGLAEALAVRMAGTGRAASPFPLPRPVLFGIGSRDPITAAQIALLRPQLEEGAEAGAPNGRVTAWPAAGDVRIIAAASEAIAEPAEIVAARFALGLANGISVKPLGTLVLSGGDTAFAVLRQLGVRTLSLGGEAAPGIPWAVTTIGRNRVVILTKSGGFGAPDALLRLIGEGHDSALRQTG